MSKHQVIEGDCLEVMATLPDNSVDLILTDPPYWKVKNGKGDLDSWWDHKWDKPAEFLAWIDKLAAQWQRILKPNGSLYCFASPKMSARVEVTLGNRFNVLNHIVWDKAGRSRAAMTCKEESRAYFPESERIIFCEQFGSDRSAMDGAGYEQRCDELRGFVFEPLRKWFEEEKRRAGLTTKNINRAIGLADHAMGWKYTAKMQYQLPTYEHYTKLQQAFPGYFTRPYEELKQQYEELRRPFAVSADVPYTDVWTFPTVQAYPGKHVCEKPSSLLEHIVQASSRPGDVVLDCFAGSGSTLAAAKKLGRQCIGIEIDPHWVAMSRQRLGQFDTAPSVVDRIAWLETQVAVQSRQIKKINSTLGQLSLFDAG